MRRRLLLLSSAFVAVRLALLWVDPYSVYNVEELFTGVVSRELASGPAFDLFDYQYEGYSGGSLVVGGLGTPLLALAGFRFLGLKLVALAWALGGYLVWLGLYGRCFGAGGMTAAGLLWAFAPPAYLRLGLMAWGNHMESVLLTGLMLALFLAARREGAAGPAGSPGEPPAATPARRLLFASGAVAALSVYFTYTSLVGIAALGLTWLALERGASLRRGLGAFVPGALAGALPWLAYNLPRGLSGIRIYHRDLPAILLPRGWDGAAAKLVRLVTTDLRRSFAPWYELGPGRKLLSSGLCLVILAALLISVSGLASRWRGRRREGVALPLFTLLFLVLFGAGYAVTVFSAQPESTGVLAYRFFSPLLPMLAALVAHAVERRPGFRAALALPPALCLAGIASAAASGAPTQGWLALRGYSYRWMGLTFAQRRMPLEETLSRARAIRDPEARARFRKGFADGTLRYTATGLEASKHLNGRFLEAMRERARTLEPEDAEALLEAVATEIRFRSQRGEIDALDPDAWLQAVPAGPTWLRQAFVRALVVNLGERHPGGERALLDFIGTLDPADGAFAWRAMGAWSAEKHLGDPPAAASGLREIPGPGRRPFVLGLGHGAGLSLRGRPLAVSRWLGPLPPDERGAFVCGVRAEIHGAAEDPALAATQLGRFEREAGELPRLASGARAGREPRPDQSPGRSEQGLTPRRRQ